MTQSVTPEAPPTPQIDPDIVPPSPIEDRHVVGDLVTEEVSEPEVTELTEEERLDFSNLMTLGRRTKKVSIMDHTVVLQTLRSADEMRIGIYTKPYLQTQGFARAYQVGVCACGIVEIDGRPIYQSIHENTDEDELFHKRIEKIEEMYPIVVTKLYEAIRDLEREFADLLVKLGKLDG